jgi:hypothetical protein
MNYWGRKMHDTIYQIYKLTKQMIEKADKCCEKDHSEEAPFKEWREAIESFDSLGRGYAEQYEREKRVIASFTQEQIDHICFQIGDWYLMMKPLLEGQHNLGHMKEKLKTMICGD